MPERRSNTTSRQSLLDCLDDAILVVDEHLAVRYANRAARWLAGSLTQPPDPSTLIVPSVHGGFAELARRAVEIGTARGTVRVVTPLGPRSAEISITNELATPGVDGLVTRLRLLDDPWSISGSSGWEPAPALTEQADQLTGLPTRRTVLERLRAELQAATSGSTMAVYFIDLDGFHHINDALGHTAGDAMLKATAAALLDAHPTVDRWGRIGGDEFLLFVPDAEEGEIEAIGSSLCEAARRTVSLGGRTFVSTVSIGYTIASVDERSDAHELMQQADLAMYNGKRRLPGLLTRFDPELRKEVLRRTELESQLRANLLGSGPEFALQPIMNVRDGTVFALEALIRFRSPTLGAVRADWCVEIAERAGLIHQLDRHVLRKASQAVEPLIDPVNGIPVSLSVNCSSTTDVHGADLATRMLEAIEEAGLPATRLIVEITESAAVEADTVLVAELARMRDAGVQIAIDDFGTGHSSLSQLEELDVDIVKIDKSFMRDVPESPRRLRYLESITALVNTLGPQLVVEGIEYDAQIGTLMSQDVPLMQGYLFARPVPANDIRGAIADAGDVIDAWKLQSGTPHQPVLDWTGEVRRDDLQDLHELTD